MLNCWKVSTGSPNYRIINDDDDALDTIFIIAAAPGGRQGEEEVHPCGAVFRLRPLERDQCRGGLLANGWGGETLRAASSGQK